MPKEFIPRDYQTPIIEHIIKHDRCAVWASLGSGKTVSTLMALDSLSLIEDNKILVISTKRIARDVWPTEVQEWKELKHLTVSVIVGNEKERIEALKKDADIHTVNIDVMPWMLKTVGKKWKWKTVVVDESTLIKSFRLRGGGIRARALAKYAWTKIERLIELTGTPNPNSVKDLWGQLWFLDKGERLERTFTTFERKYFYYPFPQAFQPVPCDGAAEEIAEKVKDICISVDVRDYYDIKEPIVRDVYAYLQPKAMKAYLDMEQKYFVELLSESKENVEVEAMSAATKSIKSLQLASGFIYDEDKKVIEVHDAKMEALEDLIEETNGENLLIAYHFKASLPRLLKRYPKARVLDHNQQTVKDWNAGKINMLFAHPDSCGHGLNMQWGGAITVFYESWWKPESRQQIIERTGAIRQWQIGSDKQTYIYNIVAKNTIDELVIERHVSKRDMVELLLERAKKKGK